MPVKARLYISVALALGFALVAGCLIGDREFPELARFLAYLALGCIGSTMKLRLPGLHGTISVNFLFILLAVAQCSLTETVLLSVAVTLVQCCWRPKTRPRVVQVLFNASAVSLSAALAYATAHALPDPQALIALVPAATVHFVMNTGMVSTVLALISNKPLQAIWRQCNLSAFPFYLVGAAIASAANMSIDTHGWRLSLLTLPVMYLVYSYYRDHMSSQTAVSEARTA
jgi:hypothetical protein